MTRERPRPSCVDLGFAGPYAVGPGGQVALEDYARALTRAEGVEAVPAPDGRVAGLHLCAPPAPPGAAVIEDIEAFARDMAERADFGLGWS